MMCGKLGINVSSRYSLVLELANVGLLSLG